MAIHGCNREREEASKQIPGLGPRGVCAAGRPGRREFGSPGTHEANSLQQSADELKGPAAAIAAVGSVPATEAPCTGSLPPWPRKLTAQLS